MIFIGEEIKYVPDEQSTCRMNKVRAGWIKPLAFINDFHTTDLCQTYFNLVIILLICLDFEIQRK